MNVLKYLDSKGIKDNPRIIDSSGQATDFYLQDLLEDYTKQLTLTDVSQQSELLFCKYVMKNVELKFNDIWVDVEDGWLCIGDGENQILLRPEYFKKLLEAINYTRCCTELCEVCNNDQVFETEDGYIADCPRCN